MRRGVFRKLITDGKGFTGLEAAIVLIAFVTVAAVFSYVMLGAGFFTAQKGKQSVDTGVKQASSALELDGQYIYLIANKTGSNGDVKKIFFYVTLTAGGTPVDLNETVLAIRWGDYYYQIPFNESEKIPVNETDINKPWTYDGIVFTDGKTFDNLLEKNEKYKIIINMTAIKENPNYGNGSIQLPKTNDDITIELKPSIGASLIINKHIPPSLTNLTWV